MLQNKKGSYRIFQFPLIVREELQLICISIPDLSITISIPHPLSGQFGRSERSEYHSIIGKAIIQAWLKGEAVLKESYRSGKKVTPRSHARTLANLKEDPLSPKEVAKLVGISYKSVQRAIDSGNLGCIKTKGGHRRVPRMIAEDWARSLLVRSPKT